ncbi:MAG: hypothetical protein ACYC4D_01480 [Thermoleophilia bacterium]
MSGRRQQEAGRAAAGSWAGGGRKLGRRRQEAGQAAAGSWAGGGRKLGRRKTGSCMMGRRRFGFRPGLFMINR